jgi:hypothetical protein
VAVPVAGTPPVGPETVAVNVKVEPRDAVEELVVTVTVGVDFEIKILKGVMGPAAR